MSEETNVVAIGRDAACGGEGSIAIGANAAATPDPLWVARLRYAMREQRAPEYWEAVNGQRQANGLKPFTAAQVKELRREVAMAEEDWALIQEHGA